MSEQANITSTSTVEKMSINTNDNKYILNLDSDICDGIRERNWKPVVIVFNKLPYVFLVRTAQQCVVEVKELMEFICGSIGCTTSILKTHTYLCKDSNYLNLTRDNLVIVKKESAINPIEISECSIKHKFTNTRVSLSVSDAGEVNVFKHLIFGGSEYYTAQASDTLCGR